MLVVKSCVLIKRGVKVTVWSPMLVFKKHILTERGAKKNYGLELHACAQKLHFYRVGYEKVAVRSAILVVKSCGFIERAETSRSGAPCSCSKVAF